MTSVLARWVLSSSSPVPRRRSREGGITAARPGSVRSRSTISVEPRSRASRGRADSSTTTTPRRCSATCGRRGARARGPHQRGVPPGVRPAPAVHRRRTELPVVAVHHRAPDPDRRRAPSSASPADDLARHRRRDASRRRRRARSAGQRRCRVGRRRCSVAATRSARRSSPSASPPTSRSSRSADILGKRVGAVKSLQHHALESLRRRCEEVPA